MTLLDWWSAIDGIHRYSTYICTEMGWTATFTPPPTCVSTPKESRRESAGNRRVCGAQWGVIAGLQDGRGRGGSRGHATWHLDCHRPPAQSLITQDWRWPAVDGVCWLLLDGGDLALHPKVTDRRSIRPRNVAAWPGGAQRELAREEKEWMTGGPECGQSIG